MEYVKIGDICTKVCSGGTPSSGNPSYYEGGSIPWLNTNEVNFCRIYSTEKKITQLGYENSAAKYIDENSVIVAMYGVTAGKSAIAKIRLTTNQACCNLSIDGKKADYEYVYYYLKLQSETLNKLANGGAQQNLNSKIIKDFKIPLPTLAIQHRIASILSAYDSQIENNQKRIKLLEQMAENLYKEWFVRFRFPGYENAEFEGGVPKGWKIEKLSDVFNFQEGPGIRNWQYVDEDGVKFINIRCIKNGDVKLESASMISKEEAYGKYKHFLLRENDIVMSCSGTLGRSAIIRKEHLPLCLNTSVIRFWPKIQEEDFSFLYGYLHSTDFINKQSEMASGAAQVNFGPMHLKLMKLLVPPKKVRIEYHKVLLPIIQLTLILKKEIDTLSIQRDLLLPRLMSGKLSI